MKKRRNSSKLLAAVLILLIIVGAFSVFTVSVDRLEKDQSEKHRLQLEETIRLSAVAYYADEGRYPESLGSLVKHYGLQIDSDRYSVYYEIFAENLMPEITVVERK